MTEICNLFVTIRRGVVFRDYLPIIARSVLGQFPGSVFGIEMKKVDSVSLRFIVFIICRI
jgi:hypothetical protein